MIKIRNRRAGHDRDGQPSVEALDAVDAADPVAADAAAYDEQADTFVPARRRGVNPFTAVLVLGVVASLGVLGGVKLQKAQAKTSTVSTRGTGAGFAGGAAGGSGTGGFGGGGFGGRGARGSGGATDAAAGGPTIGTVKLVDGDTIYVSTASGGIVKVITTPSGTKVTKAVDAKAGDLAPGADVVVQGTTNADGTVTATSVSNGSFGGGSIDAAGAAAAGG